MGYENCSFQTKGNLQEIARMAYGSGWFEGRSGGAGRMGIWQTDDGKCRVVKFNTKLSERLGGASMADDPRMLESSNRLRQELILIARSAGVDQEVMRQIRAKLGLKTDGETGAAKLLDRSDVADVVTLIGGDKIWDDALRGRDMKDYKSDAHSSFKSLTERNFALSHNVSDALKDDGSRLTADRVRNLLANIKGVEVDSHLRQINDEKKSEAVHKAFSTVFDNDFVAKFTKEVTAKGYGEQEVRTQLKEYCQLFYAACVKPDGTVSQLDERIAACRLEANSNALNEIKGQLEAFGVTFVDCFARGGSVIFASKQAIGLFQDVLKNAGLLTEANMKPENRERVLRVCENIAWVLEQGIACCTNEPDRCQTLEKVASFCRNSLNVMNQLNQGTASHDKFVKDIMEKNVKDAPVSRFAVLARGVEPLRAARAEAKALVTKHNLDDLLLKDDALLSSKDDPQSTAEQLLDRMAGVRTTEAQLIRSQFVQYRLAMLKAVTAMLDEGTLARKDLENGGLAKLLTGEVGESNGNCEKIRARLKTAAYGVFSTMTTFMSSSIVLQDDFAAEFLNPIGKQTKEFMQTTVRPIYEREFREIFNQRGPIADEKGICDFFADSRKVFKEIDRNVVRYMHNDDLVTVAEKGIDLHAVLGDETLKRNTPALHLLAVMARQEEKPDTGALISRVKGFLQETAIDKVFEGRQFTADEKELYDFVRVQFSQGQVNSEGLKEKIKLAFDGFLALVTDMATAAADGGDLDAAKMRKELIFQISSNAQKKRALVNVLAALVKEDGLSGLRSQWEKSYENVLALRKQIADLREQVGKLKLESPNPFANGTVDQVMSKQLGTTVLDQLVAGLIDPAEAKADFDKRSRRMATRLSLVKTYADEIEQIGVTNDQGKLKDLFVKRAMLRMLSMLPPKHLDSEAKVRLLEEKIRARLNEDGGLWKYVQDARTEQTSQGRNPLVGMQMRMSMLINQLCFRDGDMKRFLFGANSNVGAEESSAFSHAAVWGFTGGDPGVLGATVKMTSGSESGKKFKAYTDSVEDLGNRISDRNKKMVWSDKDKDLFSFVTGKSFDKASMNDGKDILQIVQSLMQWSVDVFHG